MKGNNESTVLSSTETCGASALRSRRVVIAQGGCAAAESIGSPNPAVPVDPLKSSPEKPLKTAFTVHTIAVHYCSKKHDSSMAEADADEAISRFVMYLVVNRTWDRSQVPASLGANFQ